MVSVTGGKFFLVVSAAGGKHYWWFLLLLPEANIPAGKFFLRSDATSYSKQGSK